MHAEAVAHMPKHGDQKVGPIGMNNCPPSASAAKWRRAWSSLSP